MPRIANIILDGRLGGPQTRILNVATRLIPYGVQTIVIIPKANSDVFYSKLRKKNISSIRLPLHRLTKKKFNFIVAVLFFFPEVLLLSKKIKKLKINIVHCNASWQIQGILAGKIAGASVVWHLTDTKVPFIVKKLFELLAILFVDAFISAGERAKEYYLSSTKLKNKTVKIIHAPVDTNRFNPEKVHPDDSLNNANGIKITVVANLTPVKGLEYFIHMAQLLNAEFDDLEFYIIGAELDSQIKYANKLKEIINDLNQSNIKFYGQSTNVPAVLKATDIYVCTSIAEASPISVWEAMSMAKPIVSTDVGDVSKVILDGEDGFIVPVRNVRILSEKVSILIKDQKLRESFGEKARKKALKQFNLDKCAKQHAEFYQKIIKTNENITDHPIFSS